MHDEMLDGTAQAGLYTTPQQEPAPIWPDSCGSYGAAWFCAETHYGQDDLALGNLRNQDFETFHPKVWERRTKGERVRRIEVAMYPGYIFVAFSLATDRWRSITNTRGVRRILGPHAERPTPIPTDVIQATYENATALNAQFEAMARAVLTGQQLRVAKGPWAGFDGVCLWHSKDRVRLMLNAFGRQTTVELATSRIEKL